MPRRWGLARLAVANTQEVGICQAGGHHPQEGRTSLGQLLADEPDYHKVSPSQRPEGGPSPYHPPQGEVGHRLVGHATTQEVGLCQAGETILNELGYCQDSRQLEKVGHHQSGCCQHPGGGPLLG